MVEIQPENLPIATFAVWALLNLILTIVTVLIAVVLIAAWFRKRDDVREDSEYEQKERKYLAPRIAASAAAVASIIVFILTQDMSLPMILYDKWSILHGIIVIAVVILAIFSKKRNGDQEPDNSKDINS